jgi:mono/diheme cytochrome c family protein
MRRLIVGIVFLLALPALADESKVQLKDGAGKELVATYCAVCHSLDYIQINAPFLDRKGWEATVNKMINVMGAPIKPEDIPLILDYLSKYYGKP